MVSVAVVIKVSIDKGHNTVLLLKKEYIYKTFIEMMFNKYLLKKGMTKASVNQFGETEDSSNTNGK